MISDGFNHEVWNIADISSRAKKDSANANCGYINGLLHVDIANIFTARNAQIRI